LTLVLVVLNLSCTRNSQGEHTEAYQATSASTFGFIVGSVIVAWNVAAGDISGGAFNPAVGSLPMIWGRFDNVWLYWSASFTGALVAALIFACTNPFELAERRQHLLAPCQGQRNVSGQIRAYLSTVDIQIINELVGTGLFCLVLSLITGHGGEWVEGAIIVGHDHLEKPRAINNPLSGLGMGTMLMCLTYMGAHLSGGEYNPAISFAVFLRKLRCVNSECQETMKSRLYTLLTHILAQCCGAFAGAGISHLITKGVKTMHYGHPKFGTNHIAGHPTDTYAFGLCFLVEFLGALLLCLIYLHSCTCPRKSPWNGYYGLAIGFSYMVASYAFADISGGAFNPAVGLLPTVGNTIVPLQIVCYWTAPLLASLVSVLFFWVLNPDEDRLEAQKNISVVVYEERKPLLCGEAKNLPCARPQEYDTERAKTGCCN